MDIIIEKDTIAYKPYYKNRIWNMLFVNGGVLVSLVTLGMAYSGKWNNNLQTIFVIGILILLIGLYRILFLDEITLIFDVKNQYIFKKYPLRQPVATMRFDEVYSIITEQENGYFYYCITRKGNIFRKNLRISTDFKENKMKSDRVEFEEQLLPAIVKILGI